jgi:hypothetical protein
MKRRTWKTSVVTVYCDQGEWLCEEIWKWSITKCGNATEEFRVLNREHVTDKQ